MFTIVATQQTAKDQLAKIFLDESIKAIIKTSFIELSNMADPRQHKDVERIKCTNGMMFRLKKLSYRIVFRIYAIEDEVVVDVYAGDTMSPSDEKYIDICMVLERSNETYKEVRKLWQALER